MTRQRAWLVLFLLALGGLVATAVVRHSTWDGATTISEEDADDPIASAVLRGRDPAPASAEATSGTTPAPAAPEHAYSLSGRVTISRTKAAVPEAPVQATITVGGWTRTLGRTISAADGTYTLPLPALAELPPLSVAAAALRVWAVVPGYAVKGVEHVIHVRRRPGPHWTADLELTEAFGVAGRVVDADGTPVAFAEVRGSRDGTTGQSRVTTDEEGRYFIPIEATLLPGEWSGDIGLHVKMPGRGAGRIGPLTTQGLEGRTLRAPDLVVHGAGVLSGVAVFPDGTPAPGIQVEARRDEGVRRKAAEPGLTGGETWTDAEGRFEIGGLQPGAYHVTPRIPDGHRQRVRCSTPDTNVRLLVPHHRIRVLVRDKAGRPLPGADVCVHRLRPDGYESSSAGPVGTSQASISWWEPPGTQLDLGARLPGMIATETTRTVREDVWSEDVVLTLENPPRPWGGVRVRVTPPDDVAVGHFWVSLATPRTGFHVSTRTNPQKDGSYGPFPPGRWRLSVQPMSGSSGVNAFWFADRKIVEVTAGAVTDVHVRPAIGGRVRVLMRANVITDDDDQPRATLTPTAPGEHEEDIWAGWEEPELSGLLRPGTWTVRSSTDGFSGPERIVTVVAGEVIDVVLELVRD